VTSGLTAWSLWLVRLHSAEVLTLQPLKRLSEAYMPYMPIHGSLGLTQNDSR
jgi:hypothetical protein